MELNINLDGKEFTINQEQFNNIFKFLVDKEYIFFDYDKINWEDAEYEMKADFEFPFEEISEEDDPFEIFYDHKFNREFTGNHFIFDDNDVELSYVTELFQYTSWRLHLWVKCNVPLRRIKLDTMTVELICDKPDDESCTINGGFETVDLRPMFNEENYKLLKYCVDGMFDLAFDEYCEYHG